MPGVQEEVQINKWRLAGYKIFLYILMGIQTEAELEVRTVSSVELKNIYFI